MTGGLSAEELLPGRTALSLQITGPERREGRIVVTNGYKEAIPGLRTARPHVLCMRSDARS